jgi:hypothetical protein
MYPLKDLILAGSRKIGDNHFCGKKYIVVSLGEIFTKYISSECCCEYNLHPSQYGNHKMQYAFLKESDFNTEV